MQVEWRKAVRERSFKLSNDHRRHLKLEGEQLKKRLYFEVVNAGSVIGQLKRERTHMEERLNRYSNELAKIKSQRMLRQIEGGGGLDEADPRGGGRGEHHQPRTVSFELVVDAPSEDSEPEDEPQTELQQRRRNQAPPDPPSQPPPVFVSKLPGEGGGGGGSTTRRSITSGSGQLFELTDSEDELLGDFLERQQRLNEEAGIGAAGAAASPRVLINGLSLEQFMKKCRSRHRMDSAIERAATFVDEWQAKGGGGVGQPHTSGGQRRGRRFGGRRMPLAEPKESLGAADAAGREEGGEADGKKAVELAKLEHDFMTLLQEAKKARYLRGRNPEILERDRELTTDEIFQSAKSP